MTIIADHLFGQSSNPRNTGCIKCGRVSDLHPEQEQTTRRRVLESEREITREAGRGIVDSSALIEFSETRAGGALSNSYVDDPGLVNLGRDRLRDTREELSDARNHVVWHIQENPGTEKSHDALEALRHILLAYDLLIRDD